MDKDIEKLETEILDRAKSSLQANIEYLLSMEREFDKDTRALYEFLREKTDYVLADCKDPGKFEEFQLYARAFTRAAYAHIEGASYLMRLMVLWAHDRGELHLSETDYAKLSEKYTFNSFKDNFNLAFNHFTRLFGSAFRPNKNDPRYQSFLRGIEARDSTMHPKTPVRFSMSGDAVRDVQLGLLWFSETFRELLHSLSGVQGK
jgi:hypothetical protein